MKKMSALVLLAAMGCGSAAQQTQQSSGVAKKAGASGGMQPSGCYYTSCSLHGTYEKVCNGKTVATLKCNPQKIKNPGPLPWPPIK